MTEKTEPVFSSVEALRFGWSKTRENLRPLLSIGVLGGFIGLLHQALSSPNGDQGLRPVLAFSLLVMQLGVTMLMVRFALRLHDGKPLLLDPSADLVAEFLTFMLTTVLYGLTVASGCILLLIPGIVWGLKFSFAGFLVIDERLDPIAAFRESARVTHGSKRNLLGFVLWVFGVNVVGALSFGVGLLVTVPTTFVAAAYVLRRLQEHASRARSNAVPAGPAQSEAIML